MAHFRYRGELPRRFVKHYGSTALIRVPSTKGIISVVPAKAGTQPASFVVGEAIDYDFTDPRSLRHLRADPRFEEIGHG